MQINKQELRDLADQQFENAAYKADAAKSYAVGTFKVYESGSSWMVKDRTLLKEFSTRMAALSWAKFTSQGRDTCASTVETLSEELDGATTHVKQLIKTSLRHDAVVGKIDPALDKRRTKVGNLANYILSNS